jgi:hypothetical protein
MCINQFSLPDQVSTPKMLKTFQLRRFIGRLIPYDPESFVSLCLV